MALEGSNKLYDTWPRLLRSKRTTLHASLWLARVDKHSVFLFLHFAIFCEKGEFVYLQVMWYLTSDLWASIFFSKRPTPQVKFLFAVLVPLSCFLSFVKRRFTFTGHIPSAQIEQLLNKKILVFLDVHSDFLSCSSIASFLLTIFYEKGVCCLHSVNIHLNQLLIQFSLLPVIWSTWL